MRDLLLWNTGSGDRQILYCKHRNCQKCADNSTHFDYWWMSIEYWIFIGQKIAHPQWSWHWPQLHAECSNTKLWEWETLYPMIGIHWLWSGVTKPISSVPLFSRFFSIVKTYVSQKWMVLKEDDRYFCKIKNFVYGEINERNLVTHNPGDRVIFVGKR